MPRSIDPTEPTDQATELAPIDTVVTANGKTVSLKGLDRRHVAFVNQRHVTEESLDEAIVTVIDA